MTKEFYLAFRKNIVFHLLLMIFSFFALLLLFVLFRFSIQTEQLLTYMNEDFEGVQIFQLHEYDATWDQNDGLERLQSLYHDVLSNHDEFSVAALGHHPIAIRTDEFRGGEQFQQSYEDGLNVGALPHPEGWNFYVINAMKMNYFSWGLLPLEIWSGRGFQEEDFGVYTGEPIPAVLGHQYRDYYEVGDIISGERGLMDLELEVIGILGANQVIFNDTADFFVDTYILLPFLSFEGEPKDQFEREKRAIYYDGKAFSYIFVEDTPEAINHMHNVIHTGANELNIDYFFSAQDRTFIRHNELNNLIHHHANNVYTLMIGVMILIIVITFILERIKYQRRKSVYETKRLLGIAKYKQLLIVISENFIIYSVVVFIVLYYAIFYSGIVIPQEQLVWFRENNISFLSLFWEHVTFDYFGFHHVPLQSTALFGAFLLVLSIIYPTVQIQKLYNGRKRT